METEEDNMEIDRVNGGVENKGSEVTRDGNEENNSVETEENRVCGCAETEENRICGGGGR